MKRDIIIIGGGLGGLVSGYRLAQEGRDVLLLEQHRIPGGYCTSFKRKGFTFDVPSVLSDLSVLEELGLADQIEWVEVEKFAKYVYPGVEVVIPGNDLAACCDNVKAAFPNETEAIDRIFGQIRKNNLIQLATKTDKSFSDLASMAPALVRFIWNSRVSFYDFLRRFTANEKLITVLSSMWGFAGLPNKQIPATQMLMHSANSYGGKTWFPKDGFQAISDLLAARFTVLGGAIRYGTAVSRILIREGRAVGVETNKGETIEGEFIISNADTKKTFLDLVGREHLPEKWAARVDAHTPSVSGLSLQIGTTLDLTQLDLNYGSVFYSESWDDHNRYFQRGVANDLDLAYDNLNIGIQAPSLLSDRLAPEGMHTLHILVMPVSDSYMNRFRTLGARRGPEYRHFKNELADIIIKKVERLIPGLSDAIVVKDLSTPLTFERYTGATGGAWYDRVASVNQGMQQPKVKTPIKNLYMTGSKAFGGGGLPTALAGGMSAAKVVLKRGESGAARRRPLASDFAEASS